MHLTPIHTALRNVRAVQPRQHSDQQSQDQSHRDQAEDAIILELDRRSDDETASENPMMRLTYSPTTRARLTRVPTGRPTASASENPLHVLSVYGRNRHGSRAGETFDQYS